MRFLDDFMLAANTLGADLWIFGWLDCRGGALTTDKTGWHGWLERGGGRVSAAGQAAFISARVPSYDAGASLRDCYSELEQLNGLKPESDIEQFLKILNMSNFFVAAFQTEYKVINEGVKSIILETARFYRDILQHKVETRLEHFPEMHLLWFFQQVVRQGYSYSFFSDAVESAAIDIANASEDDDVKAYALFFLNVIFIDMQKKTSFDWLLKDYAKMLPLSVQLGITHEGDRLKARSALMRRHDRALRQAVNDSKSLSSALENMYGRSIRSLRQTTLKN